MSSSPIEYTSFMKILLCCNISLLSASSLQKKRRNKVMREIQNINDKTMKGRRKKLLDKNIYIVSVFNCMEYIIVDCMLELVIHHFSLQLKTIILKMNNYLSIQWNLPNPTPRDQRNVLDCTGF
jgi:hypothetical protein